MICEWQLCYLLKKLINGCKEIWKIEYERQTGIKSLKIRKGNKKEGKKQKEKRERKKEKEITKQRNQCDAKTEKERNKKKATRRKN